MHVDREHMRAREWEQQRQREAAERAMAERAMHERAMHERAMQERALHERAMHERVHERLPPHTRFHRTPAGYERWIARPVKGGTAATSSPATELSTATPCRR